MVETGTQNSNNTHQMQYLQRSVKCVNLILNETMQGIPGQAHFIDVASHQLASCHNSANHMMMLLNAIVLTVQRTQFFTGTDEEESAYVCTCKTDKE